MRGIVCWVMSMTCVAHAAFALKQDQAGERWRLGDIELEYYHVIGEAELSQGVTGEIKCGSKGSHKLKEQDIDPLFKPLQKWLIKESKKGNTSISKAQPADYFDSVKEVPPHHIISYYQDPGFSTSQSYDYDLTTAPQIEQGLTTAFNDLCGKAGK